MGESKEINELEILMKSRKGCSGSTWTCKVKRDEVIYREQVAVVSNIEGGADPGILGMEG